MALVASVQFAALPAFAQDPPKKPSSAVAQSETKSEARKIDAGGVEVHINSERKVNLEKRDSAGSAWEFVCSSPCDVVASVSPQYHVVGDDLNASQPFVLDASAGNKLTLDVTPGVHNKAKTGALVVAGGAALIIGGVVVLLAGSKSTTAPGDNGTETNNQNTDFISVGSILIVAGVIAGLGGGALMYDNAHTKVEGSIGDVPERHGDAKPKSGAKATAERAPTWHDDRGPALGASQFVPIFHGTF
jgi:hypothetical protein